MKVFGLILLLCFSGALATKVRYDNYKVFTVRAESQEQLEVLNDMGELGFDLWSEPGLNRGTDIMVAPHQISQFEEIVEKYQMSSVLKTENVQTLIDNEQPKIMPRAFDWNAYHRYDQMLAWINERVASSPYLTKYNIGFSFEGREMVGLKWSRKTGNPGVFIEANIHAREWVTSATATYFLNELMNPTTAETADLSNNIDWYIIPMANPDGYEFCHTTQRLWRKTRSTTSNALCRGVDPNRNFNFQWMTGGASNNPCSDTFAGATPFSEIETRNIRDWFNSVRGTNHIKIYLAFHSFGQYVLLPWGHTTTPSTLHTQLMAIGNAAGNGFRELYGTTYTVGSTSVVLYIASGSSADWASGVGNVPVSFTFEFRDTGTNGFTLPANQIIPNGQETVRAIVRTVAQTRELGMM